MCIRDSSLFTHTCTGRRGRPVHVCVNSETASHDWSMCQVIPRVIRPRASRARATRRRRRAPSDRVRARTSRRHVVVRSRLLERDSRRLARARARCRRWARGRARAAGRARGDGDDDEGAIARRRARCANDDETRANDDARARGDERDGRRARLGRGERVGNARERARERGAAVSYTHLTLPTIYSV